MQEMPGPHFNSALVRGTGTCSGHTIVPVRRQRKADSLEAAGNDSSLLELQGSCWYVVE